MGQFQQYQLRSELQGHDEDVRLCMTACLQDTVLALVPFLGHIIFHRTLQTASDHCGSCRAAVQLHVCNMIPAPKQHSNHTN